MTFSNLAPLGVFSIGAFLIIFLSLSSKPDPFSLATGIAPDWPDVYYSEDELILKHQQQIEHLEVLKAEVEREILGLLPGKSDSKNEIDKLLLEDFTGKINICEEKQEINLMERKQILVQNILSQIWEDPAENLKLISKDLFDASKQNKPASLSWTDRWSGDQLSVAGTLILNEKKPGSGIFKIASHSETLVEYAALRKQNLPDQIYF